MSGSPLARTWRRWTRLLETREAATSLALCRIVTGLTLIHGLWRMTLSGAWRAVWVESAHGGVLPLSEPWFPWLAPGTPEETLRVMAVTACGAVLTTLGLFTRLGVFLAWLGARSLSTSIVIGPQTSDSVLFNLLFPLFFSGCGRSLSLDAWLFRKPREVLAWPRYLLIGQMTLMYWAAGVQKISSGWIPGGSMDAVWYILQWTHWLKRPIDMEALAPWYWLTQALTLGTWVLENSAPVLLLAFWFRHTRERPGKLRALFNRLDVRSIYVALALLMHLGIWATLEVGEFFGYCTAYVLCCYAPREWQQLFARASFRPQRSAVTQSAGVAADGEGARRSATTPATITNSPPADASGSGRRPKTDQSRPAANTTDM
jgi:hypothetical protein